MDNESVITNYTLLDDKQIDNTIRPESIEEYVGQTEVKENIKVFVDAAKIRNEALDHVLLYGPPGLGKTTLAFIIANELGVNIKTYDVTLTTNAYGELDLPSAISSKTILTARTLAYNYGVLLTSRLRVYEVSGNSPVLAKNTSVPFRFVYIQ